MREEGGEEWEGGWKGVTGSQIPALARQRRWWRWGEERKAETRCEYNSTAVHTKFDLNLGDLGQSTKVKRSGWQRVSPLTAHHSSTLTSGAGGGVGGGAGRRPRNVSGEGDALGSGIV